MSSSTSGVQPPAKMEDSQGEKERTLYTVTPGGAVLYCIGAFGIAVVTMSAVTYRRGMRRLQLEGLTEEDGHKALPYAFQAFTISSSMVAGAGMVGAGAFYASGLDLKPTAKVAGLPEAYGMMKGRELGGAMGDKMREIFARYFPSISQPAIDVAPVVEDSTATNTSTADHETATLSRPFVSKKNWWERSRATDADESSRADSSQELEASALPSPVKSKSWWRRAPQSAAVADTSGSSEMDQPSIGNEQAASERQASERQSYGWWGVRKAAPHTESLEVTERELVAPSEVDVDVAPAEQKRWWRR